VGEDQSDARTSFTFRTPISGLERTFFPVVSAI
jgi:hypothetical protein